MILQQVITVMAWFGFLAALASLMQLAFRSDPTRRPEQIVNPLATLLSAVTILVLDASPWVVGPLAVCSCALGLLSLGLVIRRRRR